MSDIHARSARVFPLLIQLCSASTFAQVFLNADGQTDTYRLIGSVLGGNPIDSPDCSHPEFGPHIVQQWDECLGEYVFVFYIHLTPDNDRCVAFDRQRNEIKTYGASPDYLKGFLGETVTLRWRFKLAEGFQPSRNFSHLHQIKAGDGDAADPIITLTARAGTPERMQLIHIDSSGTSQTLGAVDLALFKGNWVEVYEKLTYDFTGSYLIQITSVGDGTLLFFYYSDNVDLWRRGTTFVRPKWGIYRSLLDSPALRDEAVLFDSFCLAKGNDDCP